ncbi:MAG: ABC transporter ATP-binding protein [Cyanobacteria bacterium J06649_11]
MDTFKEIKELIAKNEVRDALKNLSFVLEKHKIPQSYHDELIVISNLFHKVENDYIQLGLSENVNESKRVTVIKDLLTLIAKCHKYLSASKKKSNDRIAVDFNIKKYEFLRVEGVSKSYSDFVLDEISLTLKSGEITCIIGRNGSGKSTLLNILAAEILSDSGSISYFGQADIISWYDLKKQISYIPQKIIPTRLNLIDLLKFNCVVHDIEIAKIDFYVQDVINKLKLENYIHKEWKHLSGGYQMRFELAKSVVWRPKILIIDEPLANLDIVSQRKFLKDLRLYANSIKHPMSIVLTSQHIEEVENITDYILFLENGKVLYNGNYILLSEMRSYSYYEIVVDDILVDKMLELIQRKLKHVIIEKEIFNLFILKVPKSIKVIDIINMLYENSIELNSFRNITFSSKRLFYNL